MQTDTAPLIIQAVQAGKYEDALVMIVGTIAQMPAVQESKIYKAKQSLHTSRGFMTVSARLPVGKDGTLLALSQLPKAVVDSD